MSIIDAPSRKLDQAVRTMRSGDMRPPTFDAAKRLGFQLHLTGPNRACWMRVNGMTEDEQYTLDFNRGYFAEQLGINPIDMVVHLDQMTSAFDAWFRSKYPRRAASDQMWYRWLGIDRLDLQVDGMPAAPGPLPVTLKDELERTPNLSANDILHAFEKIEDKARAQHLTWETGDLSNELMEKLTNLRRQLDPLTEEGFYYVQYTKRDLDQLLSSYKVTPDRVIAPCFDPTEERSLKALLGDYFVNRLEIFDPAQVLNAIQRTTSIVIPERQKDEFVQGPTCFEMGDLDVAGFINLLKRTTATGPFVYAHAPDSGSMDVIGLAVDSGARAMQAATVAEGINRAAHQGVPDFSTEAASSTGYTTGESVLIGFSHQVVRPAASGSARPPDEPLENPFTNDTDEFDKQVARASTLLLEKLEMRPEQIGIDGPSEEQLVWAANEVMRMIGKDEFLSLFTQECRNSRFFKYRPRYLETRTNLNWTQQVETRVSYHQIAELIARVEAKMHPNAQQKAGTSQVNIAPAAIKPGKRPTLIVDQNVLQYSWFSPVQEAVMIEQIKSHLGMSKRVSIDPAEQKREVETMLENLKLVFQVWFYHELGHIMWTGRGRLSKMFKLDSKDERERVEDCIDLLAGPLPDWDLIGKMDLWSRNREVTGVKVIRGKPKDKVFTTYKNDLRMSGGNDSPYFRTINVYYELARQRRQITLDTATLDAQRDLISRSPRGYDRETLQKDSVVKHVELQKSQARLNDRVSALVRTSLDAPKDILV